VAEQAREGGVGVFDQFPIGRMRGDDDGVDAGLQRAAAQLQRQLGLLAFGDVLDGAQHADDVAVLVVKRQLVDQVPMQRTVGQRHVVFEIELGLAAVDDFAVVDADGLGAVRPVEVLIALAGHVAIAFQVGEAREHGVATQIGAIQSFPENLVRNMVDDQLLQLARGVQRRFQA
jgi:hypothetical protein